VPGKTGEPARTGFFREKYDNAHENTHAVECGRVPPAAVVRISVGVVEKPEGGH